MKIRAVKPLTVGRHKYRPGETLEVEDRWAKVFVSIGSAEPVGEASIPRADPLIDTETKRRGRPPGSRNKQMAAGKDYQRTDIQPQDEENK